MKLILAVLLASITLLLPKIIPGYLYPPVQNDPQWPAESYVDGEKIESIDMRPLAAQVAENLTKAGIRIVAVGLSHGEKSNPSYALGSKLSNGLSLALKQMAPNVQLIDRATLIKALVNKNWMAIDIEDDQVFRTIAKISGVQAVVEGKFKLDGSVIDASLTITNILKDKKIAELKTRIPAPPGLVPLPDPPVRDPVSGVYIAGVGGVTAPRCKYCPQPQFPDQARKNDAYKDINKVDVWLRITAGVNGRAADIRGIKPAGYDLDQASIAAVQSWQFVPAQLPDGTPVSSRFDVEITFHFR